MATAWEDPSRIWRSGRWSLERRGDELAALAYDGRRVLRSIRAVVRDSDWNTAGWEFEASNDERMLRLGLRSAGLGSDLQGELVVVAEGDTLTVTFDAVSHQVFSTNRTGLVVLHPPQGAGSPLRVTHTDGSVEHSAFPRAISPHQPAFDIAALAWRDAGVEIAVAFSGDAFEMEDQRNWTDASFKTYNRALSLPFPYRLDAGERVVQSLAITARAVTARPAPGADERLVLSAGGTVPEIAVGASTAPDPAPPAAALGRTLLVELDLAAPTWQAALARAAASPLPLDVRFVLDDRRPAAIADGVRALRLHTVERVTAFWATGPARHVSDVAAIGLLRAALEAEGVEAKVVGGARSHFTELNREQHRLPAGLDGIVFAVTPLFHSLSTAQLVESIAMQRLVAAQAVQIAAGAPVHVGPITLRPHFNDVATTPAPLSPHADLRAGYGPALIGADDDRQASAELAAWTIASAAALAPAGVRSLAYFEEWGPRGIRTSSGDDLPVAAALAALAGLAGAPLLTAETLDDLVWAIAGKTASGVRALVANLDRAPRTVAVEHDRRTHRLTVAAGAWATLAL